jgi:hypothetical protein
MFGVKVCIQTIIVSGEISLKTFDEWHSDSVDIRTPSAPTTWLGGFIAQQPTLIHCLNCKVISHMNMYVYSYIYNIARSCCMVIAN